MLDGLDFLLAKFGEKEHLEELKDGKIFLSALKKYRNDGTAYRGDMMEGKVPLDPEKIQIFDENGIDIWNSIKNLGQSVAVSQFWSGDDELLMFCASAITKEVLTNTEEDIWVLRDGFKNAIKEFGDYVILLSSKELRTKIINSKEGVENRFGMETGLIYYRDLSDFCEMDVYRRTGSILDPYFVKSIVPYKQQNEWRMILTGDSDIQLNQFDGYIVKTSPFEFATIFKTSEFLNGFSVKGI